MDEFTIVRDMLLRICRGVSAAAPLAHAITEWATPHLSWLTGVEPVGETAPAWGELLAAVAAAPVPVDTRPHVLALAEGLGEVIGFDALDRLLLELLVACDRLPRVTGLVQAASRYGIDLPALLGALAIEASGPLPVEIGADTGRAVRSSPVLRLGLIDFEVNRRGDLEIDVKWALTRLLDRSPAVGEAMIDTLLGARQPARLDLAAFGHAADTGFLVRLLGGALAARAIGINILIHGPAGTGKTELARSLAAAAGAVLHAVGEVDEDGTEPTRWDRVGALQLAQRVLADKGGAVLLFDEMEDLIGDAAPSDGDWMSRRSGSKVFVNRLLEANPVPVIWTTNAIGNVDDAILRRMSFVLKLDFPSRRTAHDMLDRIAADEGVAAGDGLRRLVDLAPETATVLRIATRAGRLAAEKPAGVGEAACDGGTRAAEALVRALRGGELPFGQDELIDLDLFESDIPLAPLIDRIARIARGSSHDVSLLLAGPPGTSKTALAHHLARALDRPLLVKRGSDLLSRWVGGTEAAIAEAFAEARGSGGVLLFDEADSLLFDRADARTSWEMGQVNELLTWLDRHPLPVVAATNHAARLDPATLRRFVFKLDLKPLGPAAAARAFARFFRLDPPAGLAELRNLTPGDFAVVARQLRHAPADGAPAILGRLRREADAKPGGATRLGFG
jgi:transitional endoplasmic reticulum ATPase